MARQRGNIGRLGLTLTLLLGTVIGLGTYTFWYAEGAAYLRNDPAVCANCHVMNQQFDAWVKSSHQPVAVCNDCHAPHSSLPAKLWVKATNGFNHGLAFTTGRFHEPIQIKASNRAVTEDACRYCHQETVHAIDVAATSNNELSCIRCHAEVGH